MGATWWGDFTLPDDGTWHRWAIGPARLWVRRFPEEWQIAFAPGHDPVAEDLEVGIPSPDAGPPPDAERTRFALHRAEARLRVGPRSPDRPVIVRATTPFFVPPGEEATIYVSTPVWVHLEVTHALVELLDRESYRPSDTWFGPSPRSGELCYASATAARLRLRKLPIRPHRAVTVVKVRNRAGSPLALDRIRMPMPSVSLYGSDTGTLWTETVTLERSEDGELADIHLGRGAPAEAGEAARLAPPRQGGDKRTRLPSFVDLLRLKGVLSHDRMVG
jgi:hypothetical protein